MVRGRIEALMSRCMDVVMHPWIVVTPWYMQSVLLVTQIQCSAAEPYGSREDWSPDIIMYGCCHSVFMDFRFADPQNHQICSLARVTSRICWNAYAHLYRYIRTMYPQNVLALRECVCVCMCLSWIIGSSVPVSSSIRKRSPWLCLLLWLCRNVHIACAEMIA